MERNLLVRLRAEVAQFKASMTEAANATKAVGDAGEQAGAKTTKAEQAKAEAARIAAREAKLSETSMGRAVLAAEKNQQAWTRTGAVIAAGGALVTAAMVGMVKAAIDWESAWAGVTKTVEGTPQQLDELEDSLRMLAKTMPATHGEIAAVAEAAGQLGVATPYVAGFTKTMIDLGETTNLTADEAATAIAQISNVMGTLRDDGVEGIQRFGAALVALGNNGASTEREIVMMAQRIAGAAAIIGLSEAEVLGFANALASVGINVEAGGTAISRVMMNISKVVALGGEDLEQFAHIAGVSAQDFATAFREDPAEAVIMFVEGLGRIKDEGGNVFQVLEDIGMADIRVSNALLTMAGAGDLLRESIALGNTAWEENTALLEEAEKRYATTESKMQVAKNSIADTAITIGEVMLPVLGGLAEVVSSVAQWVGNLPDPLLKTAGAVLAVVGPIGLLTGGMLMLFPRLLETVDAFSTVGKVSPGLVNKLGNITTGFFKVAGATMGILALVGAVGALADILTDGAVALGAEEIAASVREIADTGDIASLNAQFDNFGTLLGFNRVEAEGLGESLARLFKGGVTDGLADFISLLPGVTGEADLIRERFAALDAQLASMVSGGSVEEVRATMAAIYEEAATQGVSIDQVNSLFGQTTDALFGVEEAAKNADGSLEGMTVRMNTATGAMENLTEAQKEWLDAIGKADASFIDYTGALDAVIAKNKDVAESTAAATESAEDSWEDFYDGTSVALADWLAELEAQLQAQMDWETNMILLSGRVSDGVLAELARMGPEGAPLVAQLVDASDEELQRLEVVASERGALATESFAQSLMDAGPVIALAAGELGDDVAREMAARIASGELTVQQALDEYDLTLDPVTVEADTAPAQYVINGFLAEHDETTSTIKINGNSVPAVTTLTSLLGLVGESADEITINGNPVPAELTLGQLMQFVRDSEDEITIGGDNATGAAALAQLLTLVSNSEELIGVDADTAAATATVNAWKPPDKAGSVTYTPSMVAWTPPVLRGTALYSAKFGAPVPYWDGGYTGDGGKYEPAGIVHKGEWVTTKERTQQYLPILRQIHEGSFPLPGYAAGGPVGWSPGDARTAYSSTNQPNDSPAPIVVTLGDREQSRGNLTVNAPVTAVGPNANDVAAQILRQVREFTRGGARV